MFVNKTLLEQSRAHAFSCKQDCFIVFIEKPSAADLKYGDLKVLPLPRGGGSSGDVKAERSGVQGQTPLYSKFEAAPSYMRPCVK